MWGVDTGLGRNLSATFTNGMILFANLTTKFYAQLECSRPSAPLPSSFIISLRLFLTLSVSVSAACKLCKLGFHFLAE